MKQTTDITKQNPFDVPLPYPVPSESGVQYAGDYTGFYALFHKHATKSYKEQKCVLRQKADSFLFPSTIGDFVVMGFLSIKDIVRLLTVSKRVQQMVLRSFSYRRAFQLQSSQGFSLLHLSRFLLRMKTVETLSLRGCPNLLPKKTRAAHALQNKAVVFDSLTSLTLLECNLPDDGLQQLLKCCSNLHSLACDQLSDPGIMTFVEHRNRQQPFTKLWVGRKSTLTDSGLCTSAQLFCASQHSNALVTLELDGVNTLSEESLLKFSKSMCKLRNRMWRNLSLRLRVEGCAWLKPATLGLFLADWLGHKNLRIDSLTIRNPSVLPHGFEAFSSCPRVLDLRKVNCMNYSIPLLKFVDDARYEQLENMSLHSAIGLSFSNVATLMKCKNLQVLDLSYCETVVDNQFLTQLGNGCRSLRSVCLIKCRQITSKGVQHLVSNCPLISCLNLAGCDLVDDECVHVICEKLNSGISSLSLFCCYRITNNSVHEISSNCPGLETLDLGWSLRTLKIEGLSHITKVERANFLQLSYRLKPKQLNHPIAGVARRKHHSSKKLHRTASTILKGEQPGDLRLLRRRKSTYGYDMTRARYDERKLVAQSFVVSSQLPCEREDSCLNNPQRVERTVTVPNTTEFEEELCQRTRAFLLTKQHSM